MERLWSSYIGFIIAVAGAAIGLGNIWKFPYMVGDNGGAAFVLVYLLCVLFLGLPVMLAEMLIGRCGHHNPVTSFESLSKRLKISNNWKLAGWWGAIALLLTFSFYSVIAGLSLAYLLDLIQGDFQLISPIEIQKHFAFLINRPVVMIFWTTVFLVMTLFVVAKGVQKGLERANLILMPFLFIILIILVLFASSLSGFGEAVDFLFTFRIEKISASVIISAMGHAFFTLAIGAGAMIVYGSYLPERYKLGSSVFIIALINIVVALMAGLAIYPLVFTFDLVPAGGPGLMFEILPVAFGQMKLGIYVGILFFIMLQFAAWTSALSLAEPLVVLLEERYDMKRISAVSLVGILTWLLSLLSIFSFNIWKDFQILGGRTLFLVIADLVTNIMLPIGALLFALFAGWRLKRFMIEKELAFPKKWQFTFWQILVRIVAPICIVIILVHSAIN